MQSASLAIIGILIAASNVWSEDPLLAWSKDPPPGIIIDTSDALMEPPSPEDVICMQDCAFSPNPTECCKQTDCTQFEHCNGRLICRLAKRGIHPWWPAGNDLHRYCCEKFQVCDVPPAGKHIFCTNRCGCTFRELERRTCRLNSETPIVVPDKNNKLDRPCTDWKEGDCLHSFYLDRCCFGYNIGCTAELCPPPDPTGAPARTIYDRDLCHDEKECYTPREFGHCCDWFQKCSKPLCDPKYDNKTTNTGREVKQQLPQRKKFEYRVPEVRGYGRVVDG